MGTVALNNLNTCTLVTKALLFALLFNKCATSTIIFSLSILAHLHAISSANMKLKGLKWFYFEKEKKSLM